MQKILASLKAIQKTIEKIRRLVAKLALERQRAAGKISRSKLLYQKALLSIGRDASPLDLVNDDLGCAESVSQLIRKVVKFPIITGTWTLNARLATDPRFQNATSDSGVGTIIICATGTGNGKIRGHVGILSPNKKIMSASSLSGSWQQNYTLERWLQRYAQHGGFAVHYYKLI